MARVEVKTRRWRRVEYERLIEAGFFQPGDPVELVGGQLIAHKGSLYARAGLADYWIVNLVDRVLEVYREATPDPAASFGWRYRSVEVFGSEASVSPVALPGVHISISDLVP